MSGKLTVGGSTALQPLVDRAAKSFQAANPGVEIKVLGGGSGAGRIGVCQGSLDIGLSDVALTAKEQTDLNCGDAVQTAIAIQAFSVVANPKGPGPVKALTKQQMQGLFNGSIKNWSEVGGDKQAVVLVNRVRGSGTRQNLANYLYDGDDSRFATGASEEDNQAAASILGQTPGAVSNLGLAFVNTAKLTTLGIQDSTTVLLPIYETILSGKWPIGGPGLAITRGPANELETAFLKYMISPQFESDPVWDELRYVIPPNPSIGKPAVR